MEDILGLIMVSFFIWICYLHWKRRRVMMDSSSYYSEAIVPQENKKLTGPKTPEKRCENGSSVYVNNPEIKEGNSAFLFKKPSPSPDNELMLPDVLDIESDEKLVLTPPPFLNPFDDPNIEDFYESESNYSHEPYPPDFPVVVHIHIAHVLGHGHQMPANTPPDIAIVNHIHTDKAQIAEFILRLRRDYFIMSDDYVDYLSQLFILNPVFSHIPSKGGVSKITEDPDIPCEVPSVTKPTVIEAKRKTKLQKFRSKWKKWTAYFLVFFPSQNANDWEDFTAHVHKNLLDKCADGMKQKEELEQSEAADIQEPVEHLHILYANGYAERILCEYQLHPKVYHIHYVEMSEEFMSDIAQKDLNDDTFTFQYSPATDTAPIMMEVPNRPHESLSATKPDARAKHADKMRTSDTR